MEIVQCTLYIGYTICYTYRGAEAGDILGVKTPHFLGFAKERESEAGGNKKVLGWAKF